MTPPLPPIPPRRPSEGAGLPPLPPRGPRASAGLPPLAPRPPRGAGGLPRIAPPGPAPRPGPPPRGSLLRLPRGSAAGGLAVLALVAAGAVGGLAARALDDGPSQTAVPAAPDPLPARGAGSPALADAVAAALPAVVQVRTNTGAQGSGVILSPSGLVVTNEHVVSGATSVRLDTDDGRTIGAVVERVDAAEDLAVLRPEVTPGQGARLADERSALRPGDQVFAIGSPFQLQNSVTAGVVSAVGRTDPESGVPMIQIDAPINPGSSGGGLFDLHGRLVGIPTAILAPIRANVGIGFAVPASRVQRLVDSIP